MGVVLQALERKQAKGWDHASAILQKPLFVDKDTVRKMDLAMVTVMGIKALQRHRRKTARIPMALKRSNY